MAKTILKIEDLPERFLIKKPQFYRGALQSILSTRDSTDASELPKSIWVPTQNNPSRFDHFEEILVALGATEGAEDGDDFEFDFTDLADQSASGRQTYFESIKQINCFNYSDEFSIREAFNGVFKEPILVNLIKEILVEDDLSARARIRATVGENAGSVEITKWVAEQVSTGASLKEMFSRLQIYLLEQRQVIVGLEVLDQNDIDSGRMIKLDKDLAVIQNHLRFTLQQDEVTKRRNEFKKQSVHGVIAKLSSEDIKGQQTLIYGKFKVERDGDDIIFRYPHPVSNLFGRKISICTLGVPLSELSPQKVFEKFIGKKMILRIYGEVFQPLNTNDKLNELAIQVFAIY